MTISENLKFIINLSKLQTVISRRFDNGLGGLGFSEFIILYQLSLEKEKKLRRIDLAERIGLTPSGITRILLPMERVGYVKKEVNKQDARSSLVMIAPGGQRRLEESLERAELICEELFQDKSKNKIKELNEVLKNLNFLSLL